MRLTIFDIDSWREIGATLARNRTRTLMTAFGIFWGTAVLALCWGGGHGMQGMVERNFKGIATSLGFVGSGSTTKPWGGFNKGRTWTIRGKDIDDMRRSIPELELLAAMQSSGSTPVSSGDKSTGATVLGVEPDFWQAQSVTVYDGRLLSTADESAMRKVAVLGKNVAGQLFGNESALGRYVEANGIYYKVVGVAGQKTEAALMSRIDDGVWVPSSVFRRTYNLGDNYGFIIFTTRRGVTPTDIRPRIARIISVNHTIAPDDEGAMWFGDMSQMFEMVGNVFSGVDLLTLFVGLGTLLAGVIGVGNIMWIIVKERSGEIGIRRAIGARPSDIIVQILSESTVLTSIAGLAGITFAVVVLGVADHLTFDEWFGAAGFELTPASAAGILAAFLLLGTAAGIIPALKAMRIKPVEAINQK